MIVLDFIILLIIFFVANIGLNIYRKKTETQYNDSNDPTFKHYNSNLKDFDLEYYNFDKKYYNKITTMLTKYTDFCEDTANFFANHFSVNQRIARLEKCIEKLDNIKTTFYDYGDLGKRFYKEITSEEYKEIYATWSKKRHYN